MCVIVHQLTATSFSVLDRSWFSFCCSHDDIRFAFSAIMENLTEFRTEASSEAAQQGLLVWLLKRIKVSLLLPDLDHNVGCEWSRITEPGVGYRITDRTKCWM